MYFYDKMLNFKRLVYFSFKISSELLPFEENDEKEWVFF